MGRRLVAILAAAVAALLGVSAVLLYAKSADSRAVTGLQPKPIFVSKQLVPAGTVLKDALANELIVKTTLPASAMPVGALTDVTGSNESLLALGDIQPGEYLQSARFGTTPLGTQAITVPKGQLAVSISLDDSSRVGAFLTPGSRIVLYDTWSVAGASSSDLDKKQTRALFDDVLVIAVGGTSLSPTASQGTQPQASGTLVTLALTPADSIKLVQAVKTGELYAALRGGDASVDLGKVITNEQSLFAGK